MRTFVHVRAFVCLCVREYLCVHACVSMDTSMCACVCIHGCVCARSLSLHPHPLPNTPDFVFNKRHDLKQDLGIKISKLCQHTSVARVRREQGQRKKKRERERARARPNTPWSGDRDEKIGFKMTGFCGGTFDVDGEQRHCTLF